MKEHPLTEEAAISPGARALSAHKGWHERGYLPHFDGGAVVQTVVFRLADSLPRKLYDEALAAACHESELREIVEQFIDEGRGSCILKHPENAAIVRTALEYFDGERYRLIAWVIMPNHVHAMIEQIPGYGFGGVVRSWKSFTAKAINKRRGTRGAIWARDYFDRFVREGNHYRDAVCYIENNPVKAGLVRTAEEWPFSSASMRY